MEQTVRGASPEDRFGGLGKGQSNTCCIRGDGVCVSLSTYVCLFVNVVVCGASILHNACARADDGVVMMRVR